jgi:hypothetical protein
VRLGRFELIYDESRNYTKSHHRLTIACLAAAAIERVREAIWTIQNEIWYYMNEHTNKGPVP